MMWTFSVGSYAVSVWVSVEVSNGWWWADVIGGYCGGRSVVVKSGIIIFYCIYFLLKKDLFVMVFWCLRGGLSKKNERDHKVVKLTNNQISFPHLYKATG